VHHYTRVVKEREAMSSFTFKPQVESSDGVRAVLAEDLHAVTATHDIDFLVSAADRFAVSAVPDDLDQEQLRKLVAFAQLTVQCMGHIKAAANQEAINTELMADRHASECSRMQNSLNMRMAESCKLMVTVDTQQKTLKRYEAKLKSMGRGDLIERDGMEQAIPTTKNLWPDPPKAKAITTKKLWPDPPKATGVQSQGNKDWRPTQPFCAGRPLLTATCEDVDPEDVKALTGLVSELKRNRLVTENEGQHLDDLIGSIKPDCKILQVLARYEAHGDVWKAVKDMQQCIFTGIDNVAHTA